MIKIYCENCGMVDQNETTVVKRKEVTKVGPAKSVLCDANVRICDVCDAEMFDLGLERANNELAYREIRKKYDLIPPEQIKVIREKYGMSQRDLAAVLGIGAATIARYETGAIPDTAMSRLLKSAEDPYTMKQILRESGSELKTKTYSKVMANVQKALLASLPQITIDALSPMVEVEDNLNGQQKFDIVKLVGLCQLVTEHLPAAKTKLNKLMFYADFNYFRLSGKSISGTKYMHYQFGPVPDNYAELLNYMVRSKYLQTQYVPGKDEPVELYKPPTNPIYRQVLSEDEIETVIAVREKFRSFTSNEIELYSHKEECYENTDLHCPISYQYAHSLKAF